MNIEKFDKKDVIEIVDSDNNFTLAYINFYPARFSNQAGCLGYSIQDNMSEFDLPIQLGMSFYYVINQKFVKADAFGRDENGNDIF